MTTATVKPEDGLREPPSLMCLPPEIRVVIYGFAVEDHLNTLITAPASSEPCFFAPGYQDKPNSCLGALALIHTSKTISIESHDAMQAVVIRRQHAFDCDRYSFHEAFDRQPESKIKESDDLVTRLDKEWRKLEEFGHQLEHMVFVKRTLKYTRLELDFEYRRAWASNDKNAICGNSSAKDVESQCFESEKAGKTDRRSGERHGFAATTTASEDSAEIKADAGLTASITADIEAKLPVICEGVQNRLAAGAGIGVSLTDAGVKAVINIIALIGAFSKTREGPGCHRGATGRNSTNRLPFTNSKITKDKPTTCWTKRRVLSTTKRMHDANMQQLIRIIIAS